MKASLIQRTKHSKRSNTNKFIILAVIVLLAAALYMLVEVHFDNPRLFAYAMKIRTPKLIVMLITAFAIGAASIVFQSIINNTIVTPCLLGMNSLYTLIHTAVYFFVGATSILVNNANMSFGIDLVLMGITATIVYSYLFKKTKHNVLYVLLIGTVLTSFFGSAQTTLTRIMDPNEYDTLLASLVASFSNINSEIIVFSLVLLALSFASLWAYAALRWEGGIAGQERPFPLLSLPALEGNDALEPVIIALQDGTDYNNYIRFSWSLLAPEQYEVYQRMSEPDGSHACGLDLRWYRLSFPCLTAPLLDELVCRYTQHNYFPEEYRVTQLELPGFDRAVLAVDNDFPGQRLFLARDGRVVYLDEKYPWAKEL